VFDEPTVDELLAAVATLLRDTLPPQLNAADAFQARVAANALDLVRRELRRARPRTPRPHQRLQALLGRRPAERAAGRAGAPHPHAASSHRPRRPAATCWASTRWPRWRSNNPATRCTDT
jgi:hypothetical protein